MVNSLKVVFIVSFYNLGINIAEGLPMPQHMQRYSGLPGSMPPNPNFGGKGAMNPFGNAQPGFNGARGSMPSNMNFGGMGAMNPFGNGQPGFNGAPGSMPPNMNFGGMGAMNPFGSSQPGFNGAGSMPPNMNFGGMGAMSPFGNGQPGFNGAPGSIPPNVNFGGKGAMNTHGSSQPGFNQQVSAGPYSPVNTGIDHIGPIEGEYGGENDVVESTFGLTSLIYSAASIPYLLASPVIGGFASIFH